MDRCVDQGYYGHAAQKATWLYANRTELPILKWDKSSGGLRLDDGFHSKEERRRKIRTGICQRLSQRQRLSTPIEFRDVLLAIARSAAGEQAGRGQAVKRKAAIFVLLLAGCHKQHAAVPTPPPTMPSTEKRHDHADQTGRPTGSIIQTPPAPHKGRRADSSLHSEVERWGMATRTLPDAAKTGA